jgi:WD40 repeat protein
MGNPSILVTPTPAPPAEDLPIITAHNIAMVGEMHRLELNDTVLSIAWSADSNQIAIGTAEAIYLYDLDNMDSGPRVFEDQERGALDIAFSHDGTLLASGSPEKDVIVWEIESGSQLLKIEGQREADYGWGIQTITFSPDDNYLLAGSTDAAIQVWEVATGQEIVSFQVFVAGWAFYATSLVFSPDSTQVVIAAPGSIAELWDIETATHIFDYIGHNNGIGAMSFSSDGKLLVSGGDDNTVRVWDVESGRELSILEGHSDFVREVAFNPDASLLVSSSWDNSIRVWDVINETTLLEIDYNEYVARVAFSPDGKILATSGGENDAITLWAVFP